MVNESTPGAPERRRRVITDLTKVALIGPDDLIRNAIALYLREQAWVGLVGVATRENGAEGLLARTGAGLVILEDGVALKHFAAVAPDARFILLEPPETIAQAAELLRQGAAGFISPYWSHARLDLAFTAIRAGQIVLPSSLTEADAAASAAPDSSPSPASDFNALTARQMEVLELLRYGLTNKQIGKKLNIAVATVKSHVHWILQKLKVQNRGEAAALYRLWIDHRDNA